MGYIPIKDKLEEIERRGRQIRRRQEKLKDDAAFLADMLLTRATPDMEAQRRLLREWEEEIEQLEQSLTFLRSKYTKYKQQQNKQMCNN
jgi:chromosome segregation ATPase